MSDEKDDTLIGVKAAIDDFRAVRLEMLLPDNLKYLPKEIIFFGLINVPESHEPGAPRSNIWYLPTDNGFEVALLDEVRQQDLDTILTNWDKAKAEGTLLGGPNDTSLEVGDHD